MKPWPFAASLALAGFAPAPASAEPAEPAEDDGLCADHVYDPLPLPTRFREVDAHRAACRHADVGVTAVGTTSLEPRQTEDLYVSLTFRVVEGEHLEWGLGVRLFDGAFTGGEYDEAAYGPVFGHLGYAPRPGRIFGVPRRSIFYAAAEVPYTREDLAGVTGALQLGHASTWLLTSRLQFHGHAGLLGAFATEPAGPGSPGDGWLAASVAADVGVLALPWLTVFAGAEAHAGGVAGWDSPEVWSRAGVHGRVKGLWRSYLTAGSPVVADLATDLAVSFGVRRDLD